MQDAWSDYDNEDIDRAIALSLAEQEERERKEKEEDHKGKKVIGKFSFSFSPLDNRACYFLAYDKYISMQFSTTQHHSAQFCTVMYLLKILSYIFFN